jgi:hypothetical protein
VVSEHCLGSSRAPQWQVEQHWQQLQVEGHGSSISATVPSTMGLP